MSAGLSACLLSIGALHMAERWQVEDAEQLLEHAEQFLGEASGEAVAVNQRARLLRPMPSKAVLNGSPGQPTATPTAARPTRRCCSKDAP